MQVKLRVIGGKNDGREIKISVPEFIIGRGEGAHLRPQNDLISRKHCVLHVGDGKVILEDLKSRNGTFLNGNQVEGTTQLKVGDRLRVGRLQFEIEIDYSAAGTKKPRVEGVRDAAIRAAGTSQGDGDLEDSITDWLSEEKKDPESRRPSTETRQFFLDETDQFVKPGEAGAEESDSGEESIPDTDASGEADSETSGKEEPGKLPSKAKMDTIDSRDAASQMLRKFFNRR